MEQRPKTLNREMALRVAALVAETLVKNGHFQKTEIAEIADCIADVARYHGPYADGFRLARELEERYGWECDLMIAEDLDGFSSHAQQEIKQAQKAWAERNNIQPPLPIGTRVKNRRGETGTIDELYQHGIAEYCVKMDNETRPGSRRILAFEDVTPVEEMAKPPQ